MQRQVLMVLAAALAFGAAHAQDGALAGVTMRVLDDISDLDAAILELDANSGEGDESAPAEADATREGEADGGARRDVEPAAVAPVPVP